MVIDVINEIKTVLNSLYGILYDINEPSDIIPSLTKQCVDKILKIDEESLIIEHKDFGDIEIKYDDVFYKINIKTQNTSKTYSFPNLISINRARDFLIKPDNNLIYIFIEYEQIDSTAKIIKIRVQKIESLDWSYLYIQNLGKGQLQIKNMTQEEFKFNNDVTRQEWLEILKKKGCEYYDNLMLKVVEYKTEWEKDE